MASGERLAPWNWSEFRGSQRRMIIPSRRSFLTGLGAALAAPAIVRFANIMPVRATVLVPPEPWLLGVRWQSWPLKAPRPAEFAVGSIGGVNSPADKIELKPLSHFAAALERHRRVWPDLVWTGA